MKVRIDGHKIGSAANASFRELKAFSEVMYTGSATAAGRQLGMTQSAISRLIAQLEETVGFELFYRERGRLVPSADARLLLVEVELALSSMERFNNLARDIAGFSSGKIRIVAPPSFSEAVLADIVAAFLEQYPDVEFSIDSRSPETALSVIAMRYADCGFVKLPIDGSDLDTEVMMTNKSVCVMHEDHPLARETAITPELLSPHPLILLGSGRSWRVQVDQAFAEFGIRPRVAVETHMHASACALAARGVGVTIVNELLAKAYLRPPLVARPFLPDILHEYAFAVSSISPPSRLTVAFRDVARNFLVGNAAANASTPNCR
jgi:DNA-binding transcriptional LysR family regulator